jgi:predicted ATP-grasp superfamily ATP-dependent carboligase
MRILVTSARMPFALDEIRKLGRAGHTVIAADTFRTAPGGHSRFAAAYERVASPQYQSARFLDDVERIVRAYRIELIVPCFEEVFYLTRHARELARVASIVAPDVGLLARLHDKAAFNALCRALDVPAPESARVCCRDELIAAVQRWPAYAARPVFSRGGMKLYTNHGPLAGALALEDCDPSLLHPWIVQPYVAGRDVCSFSVAQHGRVTAHCAYVHPIEIEHRGGIVFESIDPRPTLAIARRLVEHTGYHGQLSIDFRDGPDGLTALECNPRPTAGVHLMPDEMFVGALLGPPRDQPLVVRAGRHRRYSAAIWRDLLLHRRQLRVDLVELLTPGGDVYAEPGDRLPALYEVLSYASVLLYRARHRNGRPRGTSLIAASLDGILWNGDPIA